MPRKIGARALLPRSLTLWYICRQSLGCRVVTCNWHTLKCWKVCDALHAIMYLKHSGTKAERVAAVRAALAAFKAAFSEERAIVQHVEQKWEP